MQSKTIHFIIHAFLSVRRPPEQHTLQHDVGESSLVHVDVMASSADLPSHLRLQELQTGLSSSPGWYSFSFHF